jgi:hypothetical protein
MLLEAVLDTYTFVHAAALPAYPSAVLLLPLQSKRHSAVPAIGPPEHPVCHCSKIE